MNQSETLPTVDAQTLDVIKTVHKRTAEFLSRLLSDTAESANTHQLGLGDVSFVFGNVMADAVKLIVEPAVRVGEVSEEQYKLIVIEIMKAMIAGYTGASGVKLQYQQQNEDGASNEQEAIPQKRILH